MKRACRGAAIVVVATLTSSIGWERQGAAAQSAPLRPTVILLRPSAAPAPVAEALVRLRGELMSGGFDARVMELDRRAGEDTRASLERMAPTLSATALVAVVSGPDATSAELWVVDRVTGKTVVRRVRADPKSSTRIAEVLAVRAVELLRASFLELAISAQPAAEAMDAPVPTTPAVTRFATESLSDPDWRWAVEAGAGGLAAIAAQGAGLGPEFVPVARVDRALGPRWCARVSFAGLGTQTRVATPGGYADVSETVILADVLARFRRGRRLEPVVSLGAGTLRLSAEGHEAAPYVAGSGSQWSMAVDVGGGLRIPLRPRRFEMGLEVHALFAEPYPVVRFFDADVARAGRPTVLGSLTLLGGL